MVLPKVDKKAVVEAVKLVLRIALFGALSTVVTWALNVFLPGLPEGEIRTILTVLVTMLDKYIHENPAIESKGIAPF